MYQDRLKDAEKEYERQLHNARACNRRLRVQIDEQGIELNAMTRTIARLSNLLPDMEFTEEVQSDE